VKGQTLIWGSVGLGTPADVAVADLDGDGVQEVIALAGGLVQAYRRATSGPAPYVLAGNVAAVGGSDLLVADCDGDLAPEIYVLSPSSGAGASLSRFDRALAPAGAAPLPVGARSLHLEDLGDPRKNLVVATAYDAYGSSSARELVAVDARSGEVVWRISGFRGAVSPAGPSYLGAAPRTIAFGTDSGMYATH
jgi:outer membrane protein assembly factor BamB